MALIKTNDNKGRDWKIGYSVYPGIKSKCSRGQWFPADSDDIIFDSFEVKIHGKWFEMPQRIAEKYINLNELDFDYCLDDFTN